MTSQEKQNEIASPEKAITGVPSRKPPPLVLKSTLNKGGVFQGRAQIWRILSRFGRFWAACGAFCLCTVPKTSFFRAPAAHYLLLHSLSVHPPKFSAPSAPDIN